MQPTLGGRPRAVNIRKWSRRLDCERAFEVYVSREPTINSPPEDVDEPPRVKSVYPFAYEFGVQLGVGEDGAVCAECPYEGCDGSLGDFWRWDNLGRAWPDVTETPEPDTLSRLYPQAEASAPT